MIDNQIHLNLNTGSGATALGSVRHRIRNCILVSALALAAGGCASLQPTTVTGPKGNEQVYPVLFPEDPHRREASILALKQLLQQSGASGAFAPELQPITGTIRSLPPAPSSPLYLPKLGVGAVMTEEETRESLRLFIKDSRELIGSDPVKLSLVERVDQPDGSKLAIYQQRPFRYPIKGNYGKLEIRFTPDRRIINISSTCIPQAEQIQATLATLRGGRLKIEDVIKQLRESGITYTDAQGKTLNFKIPPAGELNARGLVTYILPSSSQPDTLEFHQAWEIQPAGAPMKTVYIDAINGETIAIE